MSNALINEKSPYLLSHAENPVDWLPWCEEAFARARREDKPVFLSIGYSSCHWCHVMAQESFEDAQVAELLNRYFVSVKVDREERPDVDAVYIRVCQALTGSAGWPLTIIMTPEQQPFFAGTYLPKNNYAGRAGLLTLLRAIADKWRHSREELLCIGRDVTALIAEPRHEGAEPAKELLSAAAAQLAADYDAEYGGFGTAPKFPSPHKLIFLQRYAYYSGDKKARQALENTLRQMYRGGIYDHFGGGFARYSTDREWLAPHFEKTLYDNALLALCYTEAWQDGRMALYRQVAESTLDYCLSELRSEAGGFYCAQDADSGGEEGAYYLFTPQEIKRLLGEDDGRHFCECYDITEEGNLHGSSIPNLLLNTRWSFVPEGYAEFRQRLREYRRERMPLGRDEKILTSWNGMMLMALSRAARAFDNSRYLAAAEELQAFVTEKLGTGHDMLACFCGGEARLPAQLDDYAFWGLGLLELYRTDAEPAHILKAMCAADEILQRFADPNGGFYRTAKDAERLIIRPKEVFDGAIPSGNSAAAQLFVSLARLSGEEKWRRAAEKQLEFMAGSGEKQPSGICFALCAMLEQLYPTKELVCAAPDEEEPAMLTAVRAKYAPELEILLKTPSVAESLAELAPFTRDCTAKDGRAQFYLCEDGRCSLPSLG